MYSNNNNNQLISSTWPEMVLVTQKCVRITLQVVEKVS